ncbi:MAG TPA: preprotein translocase subunit SecE [Gemmatimonadales bacterium]
MATEAIAGARRGLPARVLGFLRDVRGETRKVTWPTWIELRKATTAIVIFVIALGIVVGLMDSLFQFLLVTVVAKIF